MSPDLPDYTTKRRAQEFVLQFLRNCCDAVLLAAQQQNEALSLQYVAKTLHNLVLHRLGEPVIHCRHIPPGHAILHEVGLLLRSCVRRSRFGVGNHRSRGGLLPTCEIRRRRRRYGGGLSPGGQIGTACGLLLFAGVLAVAPVMATFPSWIW